MGISGVNNHPYQFSRYLHLRRKGRWVTLFHELHPDPIYCGHRIWGTFLSGNLAANKNLAKKLKLRGLILDSSKNDTNELRKTKQFLENKLNRASILYLILSQSCNLGCKYCPFSFSTKEAKNNDFMSARTARAAIKLWSKHIRAAFDPNTEYCVIFYGGEPLLNQNTFKASIKFIEKLKGKNILPKNNLRVLLSTNGILLNKKIVQFLKKHNVMVMVGIDGPQKINDRLRIDTIGRGVYLRIKRVIEWLTKNKIKTFASVSITPYNINKIKNYSKFFSKLGIKKFGFNILRGGLLLKFIPRKNLTKYYIKAADGIINNFYKQNNNNLEYQMEKKYQAFYKKDFFPFDCTCYGGQLVVYPDGTISNCPFSKNRIKNVVTAKNNFRIWNTKLVKKWRNKLPLYNKACDGCGARSICGGGCAWSTLEIKGRVSAIDDATCIFTKKVFDRFIWSGLNKKYVKK